MKKTYLAVSIIFLILIIIAVIATVNRDTTSIPSTNATSPGVLTSIPGQNGTTTPATSTSTPSTATSTPSTSTSTPTVNPNLRNLNIKANDTLSTGFVLTGESKGWYFEASFPVKLVDAKNKVLYQGPATAQGDWMTSNFVPFKVTLTFAQPTTETGTLILQNDNPSGLPENLQEVKIPVSFKASTATTSVKAFYPNSKTAAAQADVCDVDSVTSLTRVIPKTATPIQDAINAVISGNLSATEKTQGYSTDFPNAKFKLLGATLINGTLTLEFNEVPGFTSGGACKMGLLSESIIKTAKQFPEVKKVEFKPNTLFQP